MTTTDEALGLVAERLEQLSGNQLGMLEALEAMLPMIKAIYEACTAERPPSPLAAAMRELAATIDAKVGELTDAVREQPEAVRDVIRQELTARANAP